MLIITWESPGLGPHLLTENTEVSGLQQRSKAQDLCMRLRTCGQIQNTHDNLSTSHVLQIPLKVTTRNEIY